MNSSYADSLLKKINAREARVGVIGLGYVGLPLALTFAEQGFPTLGFDTDPVKVDSITRGKSYISYVPHARLQEASARFSASCDFARLAEADAILVCVPTPLTPQSDPDLSYVEQTAQAVKATLRPGQLIVLESTTYPGTTDELVRGILENDQLRCGRDFFLAFSPEREDPGNASFSTRTIPKVVGGVDEAAGRLAVSLYEKAFSQVVPVSSARVAEAVKLTENVFRAVNIALVNELKTTYDRMGIDVWEVLEAASTKPFGFMRFNPGPGLGGHCIPLDPFYLSWKAREFGVTMRFIELAGEINVAMPRWVVGKVQTALNGLGKPLKGSRILLLGIAYKKNVADTRESPALEIMALLEQQGANVEYHDPMVPKVPMTRHSPKLAGRPSVRMDEKTLGAFDAALVVTDHDAVDYELLARIVPLVVDCRGVYRQRFPALAPKIVSA